MKLVGQWRRILEELPEGSGDLILDLVVPRADQQARAAALLGPAGPGRMGQELRFSVHRAGGGIGFDQAAKLLGKLDEERIRGTLALVTVGERAEVAPPPPGTVAEAWQLALAALPRDWSDLYCELELTSTDHLDRAALLIAPVNPARVPGRSAFRFRVAQSFGYGASPTMTRRCFERLDGEGIPGRLTMLHVLSDTHNVDTQGPVWRVGGRAV
ncbi:MAG: hypothetical protein M3R12_03415 [Actinomycetota bacterium]|nr:hypothetical protein [Actinomycetota bacterium]